MHVDHIVFQLIDISVRTKDGTVGGIETFEKTVTECQRWLRMVGRRKNGRAANVSQCNRKVQVRRNRSRIPQGGAALVIEKLHTEARVDRRLVRISCPATHLV